MSIRNKGDVSVSLLFRLTDAVTGAAKSGIGVTTLSLQYAQEGQAPSSVTPLTQLGSASAAFTAYGAFEIDSVNSPGMYRVDAPNAAFATGTGAAGTGAREVALTVTGSGIEPATRLFDLRDLVDGKTEAAALQIVAAAAAGNFSGAGTGTEVATGLDGATVRGTATVDDEGNRTVVYS